MNLLSLAAETSRLTNEVITHTHHHPGPGNNAHTEAECRAAVSNRFEIKWRCLTAGGVHVAELSGALVMEAKPQCKGRPAAIGRVLQRLVKCRLPGALFWQPNRMPTPDTLQDLDPLRQEPEHRAGGNYPMITPDCPAT